MFCILCCQKLCIIVANSSALLIANSSALLVPDYSIPTNLEKPDSFCKFNYTIEQYTQQNVIEETACLPLHFQPGSKFEYSGRNYFLLGMLIEKLTGKTFEGFLTERIFIPLAMDQTGMINYKKIIPNSVDSGPF